MFYKREMISPNFRKMDLSNADIFPTLFYDMKLLSEKSEKRTEKVIVKLIYHTQSLFAVKDGGNINCFRTITAVF